MELSERRLAPGFAWVSVTRLEISHIALSLHVLYLWHHLKLEFYSRNLHLADFLSKWQILLLQSRSNKKQRWGRGCGINEEGG
jgi:hypothetical protein